MNAPAELYGQLAELSQTSGKVAVVDRVIEYLEQNQRFHELFEALKMRARMNLGLVPTQTNRDEKLDEETELKIERALIEACRRVGEGLLRLGKVREGWMYMRPVGDLQAAADALAKIEPNDENTDALLEVLVHEGVNVQAVTNWPWNVWAPVIASLCSKRLSPHGPGPTNKPRRPCWSITCIKNC